MSFKAIPLLKFVGTVSLGLLTGVSYTVSRLALPSLLELPSSASAADTLTRLTTSLQTPLVALSSLTVVPFVLSFALAPRQARHPYLVYTSLLTILSYTAPRLLAAPAAPTTKPPRAAQSKSSSAAVRARMEASYEVLGDVHSEPASEEDTEDVNGEDVRIKVEGMSRGYGAQAVLAALGFAMSVVGLWGDGVPQVIVS